MKNRVFTGIWLLLLLGATYAATQAHPEPSEGWMLPILIFGWLVTAIALIPSPLRRLLQSAMRHLRAAPFLYWLLLLIYICAAISEWLVPYQPNYGHEMRTIELVYVLWALWLLCLPRRLRHGRATTTRDGRQAGQKQIHRRADHLDHVRDHLLGRGSLLCASSTSPPTPTPSRR